MNINRTLITMVLTALTGQTFAANASYPHLYLQGQFGYADTHGGFSDFFKRIFGLDRVSDSQGVTGRVSGGYALNHFLAVEMGVGAYPSTKIIAYNKTVRNEINDIYDIDLIARLSINLPFTDNFSFFVQGGPTLVHTHHTKSYYAKETSGFIATGKAAIGLNYNFCEPLGINLLVGHIFEHGDIYDNNYSPAIDTIMLGLSYRF